MREFEYSFHPEFDPPRRFVGKVKSLREWRERAAHILGPSGVDPLPEEFLGGNMREDVRGYVREWKRLRKRRRSCA